MRILLFFICIGLVVTAKSQNVSGAWYGVADAANAGSNNNNYLTELTIKQKGENVEGVFGYYFRSGYQSYYVHGKYDAKTRVLTIKDIPITYFKNRDIDGVDCPMNFYATLLVSKVNSRLTGSFISQEKYKYTCPELKVAFALDINDKNQDSIIGNKSAVIKKYWQPGADQVVVNTKDISKQHKDSIRAEILKDSAAFSKVDTAAIIKQQSLDKLVKSFEKRKNVLSGEIEIENDSVRVSYYDNGIIDGDTISVFINKVPVLVHQGLSEKAITIYLAVDSTDSATEISMFADNLGKYPPNTALMVILDGEKRHEVFLSSNFIKSGTVKLKRKKP
jgi:hypothetical protein